MLLEEQRIFIQLNKPIEKLKKLEEERKSFFRIFTNIEENYDNAVMSNRFTELMTSKKGTFFDLEYEDGLLELSYYHKKQQKEINKCIKLLRQLTTHGKLEKERLLFELNSL